ncbi:hypothetical protein [Sphingomonas soli]|uniref:hypothetical protein n=1 Tax=Sphingomonas soli TaxID=266127 RepID=UPI0008377E37|nr:hypothetical protein [Sphingomonas soli]
MSGAGIGHASRSFTYAPPHRANLYKRLLTVTFTHTYYTQDRGLCGDFRATPSDATSQLMASLGLAFKNEGTGFAVFYQPDKLSNLIEYLRREARQPGASGFWTRMTFLLELTNPEFVGITSLPIQTKLSRVNLFGCNLDAHPREARARDTGPGVALLAPGNYMGGEALHEIVGASVALTVPPETRRVVVTDLSGAVVLPAPGTKDVAIFDGSTPDDPKHASLDFSSLPHDFYTISLQGANREPIDAPGYPREVLYVPPDGGNMVLLDLLFTQPEPESGGIYPLPSLFGAVPRPADCGGIAYELAFEARRTYWQYYVVSQIPGSQLQDVEIAGPGAEFEADAQPVRLPDGSLATLFNADTPLPLRQKSGQHFHLKGTRRDASGHKNRIALSRLPVAPAAPVWPGPADESATGTSEIFVYV